MYEDDFLESRYEDLNGFPEDPADYDFRDFDRPDEFFDDDPEDDPDWEEFEPIDEGDEYPDDYPL